MTTALPSIYTFMGDNAFDAAAYDWTNTVGSPFRGAASVLDSGNLALYDKFMLDPGPRDPDDLDPDSNYFLEYQARWFSSGATKANAYTTGANSLRSKYIAMRTAGKTVQHYVGGVHYTVSINAPFWEEKRASRFSRSGRGRVSGQMQGYLRDMFGWLIDGTALCELVIDGAGGAPATQVAFVDAVHFLEDMGFPILVETFAYPGTAFVGYPSLTFSSTAITDAALFDVLPAHDGVLVTAAGYEAYMATWRADDRAIYAGQGTVIPGPWTEFGEYGE